MKKYQLFRKKYPQFIYHHFSWQILPTELKINFHFEIPKLCHFFPKISIVNLNENHLKKLKESQINNLVFHLGLIEMLSYWKATASPEILIFAGPLKKKQINWWEDLIVRGMGQFFFENKIDFREKKFLTIKILKKQQKDFLGIFEKKLNPKNFLVPVGGGKDSIVTLEYLKKFKKNLILFSLNPKTPQRKIIEISGVKEKIFVWRKIDEKLLELNRKGFLNGHTPFTAYLSFLSVLIAILKDCKFIVFSNEKSSEEGNVEYLGEIINHQYSKTKDFERKFRWYSKNYLARDVEYFSLLRPLYEIEISALFSQFPQYFNHFVSCNFAYKIRGKIKKKWCGRCPKCLFIFTSLYPFLGEKIIEIFKKNLFEDKSLLPLMLQLVSEKKVKPFECVGTKKESFLAFNLSLKRWEKTSKKLPYLLSVFKKNFLSNLKKN